MSDSYYVELPNGVRIISKHLPEESRYGLTCFVAAGEKHAGALENGLPHFLEHLIFSGTSTRTSTDIDAMRRAIRGGFGASTSEELTAYYGHALKEEGNQNLSKLSGLIADILGNSVLPDERIEHEREVIINELYERSDILKNRLTESVLSSVFHDHPYARKIGGTPDTVSSFSKEDFFKFMGRFYTGDRMTVGITGPDSAEEMATTVIEDFSHIKGGRINHHVPDASFHEGESRQKTSGFIDQNHFRILVPLGLSARHEHYYGSDFIEAILDSRLSSLRDRFSKSYGITSRVAVYSDISFIALEGCTRPATSDAYLRQVANVIGAIKDGFTKEEFNDVLIPKARDMEEIHRYSYPYMQEMMNDLTFRGRIFDPAQRLDDYRRITYEYANDFLRQCIGDEVNIVHMGPSTDFMSLDNFKELALGSNSSSPSVKTAFSAPGIRYAY